MAHKSSEELIREHLQRDSTRTGANAPDVSLGTLLNGEDATRKKLDVMQVYTPDGVAHATADEITAVGAVIAATPSKGVLIAVTTVDAGITISLHNCTTVVGATAANLVATVTGATAGIYEVPFYFSTGVVAVFTAGVDTLKFTAGVNI